MSNKRALTKEQAHEWVTDTVREVSQEMADEMKESLRKLEERQDSWEKKFTSDPRVNTQPTPPEKGINAARLCRAIAATKGIIPLAADWSEKFYGSDSVVTKQLQASNATAGGFLIEEDMSSEVIELLRANVIVEQFNPRRVPLDKGSVSLPKITAGSAGSWIGEGTNLTHTAPTFGQVTLSAKKYGALVAISNDLLRYATPDTDRLVRDDLVGDLSTALDLAYLRGDGMAADPVGLLNLSNNSRAANSTVNLANVTTDIGEVIRDLLDDDVRISTDRSGFMWAPRTWQYLATVRDGNGNLAFKPELDDGTLFGFPWRMTSAIPINLGSGTNESEVYFVNFPDVVIGQASTIELDASADAAYHNGTAVVAAFSRDETVIRAIVRVDINVRYQESVGLITAVTWGA